EAPELASGAMPVEVSVHLQESAASDLVQPAAFERRIGEQAVDPCERPQEVQERSAVQVGHQLTRESRKLLRALGRELDLIRIVIALGARVTRQVRKLLGYCREHHRVEELVEHRVR